MQCENCERNTSFGNIQGINYFGDLLYVCRACYKKLSAKAAKAGHPVEAW